MGAPKKDITADSHLHIRVKKSDKEAWFEKANGNLSKWVVKTLNKEVKK